MEISTIQKIFIIIYIIIGISVALYIFESRVSDYSIEDDERDNENIDYAILSTVGVFMTVLWPLFLMFSLIKKLFNRFTL